MTCVVTVNDYTADEAFPDATLVVDSLGDPGDPAVHVLANRGPARPGAFVTLDDLAACLADLMAPATGVRPIDRLELEDASHAERDGPLSGDLP